ncbi:hypothetical protein BP6252_10160 [Coleophoma cylindrospora]|uniref:Uncharacterized protein n=1 Tax=Coleophoma cylindrospora TaxID=1849047 RepID=A0A3D8QXN2_9HELO|nr:hypothetical protein BP6252_10160 [Coleophoma cylindrospora]
MAPQDPKRLSALNTHWHNRSQSSSNSDAGTFHSAIASHTQGRRSQTLTSAIELQPHKPARESRLESIKMDRSDSGYEDGVQHKRRSSNFSQASPRHSTSSRHASPRPSLSTPRPQQQQPQQQSQQPSQSKRRSQHRTTPSSSSIATPPRRSTSSWRAGAPRPSLHARHTTPYIRTSGTANPNIVSPTASYPQAYFQFPPIALTQTPQNNDELPSENDRAREREIQNRSPPPTTIQYWTSDSTRRLEYAAIDAASKGVRGFVRKMIPDCFLPSSTKAKRFHDGDDDDVGSVRRYRLDLPEEEDESSCVKEAREPKTKEARPIFRRWTTFGSRRKAD